MRAMWAWIGESRKDDRLDAQTLAGLAKHRRAKAQADLTVIRGRAGLVRARTALVNTARGLAKSYGERLRGCNLRNMNPVKAQVTESGHLRLLSPEPFWFGNAAKGDASKVVRWNGGPH